MPTLEELFKSKQLLSQGGKTAEEAYAVRNSKKIRISSSNALVSTIGMLPAKGARALLGIKGSESLLEEEITGLRIIRTGSIPFIYGSDLGRLILKTTDSISTMKQATAGEATEATGAFAKIGNLVGDIKSALGLPTKLIPSFVVSSFEGDELLKPNDRYEQLKRIKASAAGTPLNGLLGFIGKNAGGGNLSTMGRNLVGGAISAGKQELGKKIFGERGGNSLGSATGGSRNIGIKPTSSNEFVTIFTDESNKAWGRFGYNYGSLEPSTPPSGDDKESAKYSKTIDTTPESKDGLAGKQVIENVPAIKFTAEPERAAKFSFVTKNENYKGIDKQNFLEAKRGMYTISDTINKQNVYKGETKKIGNTELDDFDFVTLKFTSLGTVSGALHSANFRATISGLSETFSPSWDSGKFIGSPFNYYTYSGIERSVTFNFKVYSLDASEHKIAWDKLNFLSGLVYPADYYGNSAVKPPIIKFTLGDMYKAKAGFIESLSYTIDDNTPWQVMDKEQSMVGNVAASIPPLMGGGGISQNAQTQEIDMKGYKLPTIVDVAVTIKFIENRSLTGIEDGNRKFYTFTPQSIT
jgi:hypothetical protein